MTHMKVPATNDELKTMVFDILKRKHKISEWEDNFAINMVLYLEGPRPVTENQVRLINEIWEKATEDG